MSPSTVIGAEYWPGLSDDLSSWKLWISSSGSLSQLADVCRPFEGVEAHYKFHRAEIGEEAVRCILQLAERIGFATLHDKYECGTTDCCTQRVAPRLGGRLKIVEVDLAATVPGFEELWFQIHRYAPFVNKYHQR
jgi:hypothetical protein